MKNIYFMLLLVFLASCELSVKEQIVGNYYIVSSPDNHKAISLSYYLEPNGDFVRIVGPGINKAKFNEKYIFVKKGKSLSAEFPKGGKEYYIVPICENCSIYDKTENYMGPFDKVEFDSVLIKLNVKDNINFD